MTVWKALLLGTIQGLTEFLPISSSGHLVFAEQMLGVTEHILAFNVIVHIATLLAVIFYFWKDLTRMIWESIRFLLNLIRFQSIRSSFERLPYAHVAVMILIASVPTGFMGIVFKEIFEAMFKSVLVVGAGWILIGFFLIESKKFQEGTRTLADMNVKQALLIGFIQGLAITPGISRSGASIMAALYLRFNRKEAAEFSFFLSIPAVLGAILLKSGEELRLAVSMPGPIWAGFLASGIVGFLVIFALLDIIRRGKLHVFGYYCSFIGLVALFYGLVS